MQINWDNFRTFNQDSRGVEYKFEDLCRQLFVNENLGGNKEFKYLHANPNNYGLETEPIYDEINKRWIGFQAKFFKNRVDYDQIKHSAKKIIEYYTGKAGHVDLVYLFSNESITVTAQGYVDTVNLLKSKNIKIQLITNDTILDLVRNRYPYLGLYYFGNHTIHFEWFLTHANHMYDNLGERYNREFNVETDCLDELSLFIHDQRAADYLNAKKEKLQKSIEELYWKRNCSRTYLSMLREAVAALPDVNTESLYSALTWEGIIKQRIHSYLDKYTEEVKRLIVQQEEAYSKAYKDEVSKEEKRSAIEKAHRINQEIDWLTSLINLPEVIAVTERERSLLYGQIVTLSGRAGTGKSQLLAAKTKSLLDSGRTALLLIAGNYFTSDPIHEQITKNLRLDFSLEELIDVLENIGEKNNCIVPIFIDAINETWNNSLWKTGLSPIVDKVKNSPMVKMVVSYRPEYEKLVLPDSMIIREEGVVRMVNRGFEENSIQSIREFLNHYNIPFTPLEYFGYEMTNPLFLTLYCKTYNGEEVSLPTLYERLIEKANTNIYIAHEEDLRRKGYSATDNIVRPLVIQIAKYLVTHDERTISKPELVKLDYWNEYGLTPAPMIVSLIKENILHNSTFDNEERLFFAYTYEERSALRSVVDKMNSRNTVSFVLHISMMAFAQ